jgi:hypothetical protein
MALKPGRDPNITEISYFCYSTAERGGIVCGVPSGSLPAGTVAGFGESMDSPGQRVEYATNASGKIPLGMLATDVVNIDQATQILNPFKSQVQIGNKVTVYVKGWAVTNYINPGTLAGVTLPAAAYVGLNGYLYAGASYNTASGYPRCGTFLSYPDTDGYTKVRIDM